MRMPVFPEIDTLPGSQHELPFEYRDRQTGRGKGGFDMCRHVICAFEGMGVMRIVFRHQTIQPGLEIMAGGRVGIFLNQQAGRGMPDKQRTQTFAQAGSFDDLFDLPCNGMQALSVDIDVNRFDHFVLLFKAEKGTAAITEIQNVHLSLYFKGFFYFRHKKTLFSCSKMIKIVLL